MKKPFLANFEVNIEDNKPDEERELGMKSDPDESICGFTQRTRATEDSDVDESII